MIHLPNCTECGSSERVTILECLGDNEYCICYRVCCSGCGGDWMWMYWFDEADDDEAYWQYLD